MGAGRGGGSPGLQEAKRPKAGETPPGGQGRTLATRQGQRPLAGFRGFQRRQPPTPPLPSAPPVALAASRGRNRKTETEGLGERSD